MSKIFNIAGPCISGKHYMLPSLERLKELSGLIKNEQYFVIHAARQSGKTTLIQDLMMTLNEEKNYHALYCSLEAAQGIGNYEKGIATVISCLKLAVEFSTLPLENYETYFQYSEIEIALNRILKKISPLQHPEESP